MPIQPCLAPTDSIDLEGVNDPVALKADVRVSPERGNGLRVRSVVDGDQGVAVLDGYAANRGGVGVSHPRYYPTNVQTPAVRGVQIEMPNPDTTLRSNRPILRLPGAGGDPFWVATYDADDFPDLTPTAPLKLSLAVADATNPRIDRVVLGWNTNGRPTWFVKTGTPTAGATLDNLSGAQAVDPLSEVRWADVLVDAGALTISSTTKIRDRRPLTLGSGAPVTGGVVVQPRPVGVASGVFAGGSIESGVWTNQQAAILVEISEDVVANFFYWTYQQNGATALSGTYAFALFDLSRRLVCQTGVLTFIGGSTGAIQRVRAGFATGGGTLLRAGKYYGWFGIGSTTGTIVAGALGVPSHAMAPGVAFHRAIGSTNVPTTFSSGGMTDFYADVAATGEYLYVPQFMVGDN
jgi:hypothetical protein